MVRAGVFLLDTSLPRYYTCCGHMHIKIALLVLIVLFTFVELLETIAFVMADQIEITTFWQLLYEGLEYVIVVFMILAFIKERSIFLMPFIGQMLIATILLLLMCFQDIFIIIFPFSDMADEYIMDKSLGRGERMSMFFFFLVFTMAFTVFAGWCVQVGFISYMYFEDVQRKKQTASSRPPVDTRLVRPQAEVAVGDASTSTPKAENFQNPNFSISDDEDDEIFRPKGTADMV